MKRIIIGRFARTELRETAKYYQEKSLFAKSQLIDDFEKALKLISAFPEGWPSGIANTRRCLLSRFPYAVIYIQASKSIRVIAFASLKRKPDYWKRRLK